MIHIIAEGPFDKQLIEVLLADLASLNSFAVETYGGRDSGRPVARKHLLKHKDPVVFVIDADTADPEKACQQQRDLEDYFRWGGHGLPFQVIMFIPTIEVVFFDRPAVLKRLLDRPIDAATKVAGRVAPKEVLESLLPELKLNHRRDLLERLTVDDLRQIREHEQVAAIREFVEQHQPVSMVG